MDKLLLSLYSTFYLTNVFKPSIKAGEASPGKNKAAKKLAASRSLDSLVASRVATSSCPAVEKGELKTKLLSMRRTLAESLLVEREELFTAFQKSLEALDNKFHRNMAAVDVVYERSKAEIARPKPPGVKIQACRARPTLSNAACQTEKKESRVRRFFRTLSCVQRDS